MKKTYDSTTGVKTWLLEDWWQKAIYWIGIISFWFYAICFSLGFFIGIIESL